MLSKVLTFSSMPLGIDLRSHFGRVGILRLNQGSGLPSSRSISRRTLRDPMPYDLANVDILILEATSYQDLVMILHSFVWRTLKGNLKVKKQQIILT